MLVRRREKKARRPVIFGASTWEEGTSTCIAVCVDVGRRRVDLFDRIGLCASTQVLVRRHCWPLVLGDEAISVPLRKFSSGGAAP